jgi:hypothetical protein
MRTPEIAPLVKWALSIVMLFMARQYEKLEHWARIHAAQALEWKEPLPYFFQADERRRSVPRTHSNASGPDPMIHKDARGPVNR